MTRRADRLFEIIQLLRLARGPMTASALAEALEVSPRTVYRDVAALIGQRIPIRGEAGTGYVLERGFELPPLTFTPDELEAVALGARWVATHADPALARAAGGALEKITAVIPERLRHLVEDPAVGVPPRHKSESEANVDMSGLRAASQRGERLEITYEDAEGRKSVRTIWPFLIGYHEGARAILAWCELRQDFRAFLVERLRGVRFEGTRYPEAPAELRRRFFAISKAKGARDERHS